MLQCRSKKGRVLFLCIAMVMGVFLMTGCSGDDGATGPQGEQGLPGEQGLAGQDGVDGVDGADGADGITASEMAKAESCAICHNGVEQVDGASHQEVYNNYSDTSAFDLVITTVATVGADSTITFTLTKDGVAYEVVDLAGDLDQERFIAAAYDSTTRQVTNEFRYDTGTLTPTGTPGEYTVATSAGDPATFAPETSDAFVYAYVADGKLETEGMQLYNDVDNAGTDWGDVGTYVSVANVTGCEKCHGTPYMKHGYRAAEADTLPDFMACKACHVDTTNGSHPDWQLLADDEARYAELYEIAKAADESGDSAHDTVRENMTADELTKYAYTRSVMNDVHMSHNMEFAYPQSMRNCATCHEGNLEETLEQINFVLATCQSCHAVDGLEEIVPHTIPDPDVQACNVCHIDEGGGIAPPFAEFHTGYDPLIYTADGIRYADAFNATIDSADLVGNVLTFTFTGHEAIDIDGLDVTDIAPSVLLALYGYGSKDFIVSSHGRNIDSDRDLEFTVGEAGNSNARFTTVAAAGGSWTVSVDLSFWSDMIDEGIVKRAEIAVRPVLKVDEVTVAVNAPSKTFNLAENDFDNYYTDMPIVAVDKCNVCHDALGTSFHSPDRGGNVVVCRICHVGLNGGSHLEMQSRSIDSYVHAVHSFQPFDYEDVDFTDPVEAMHYDHHVESTFPNFTILNCESCHDGYSYDVPDQYLSMPGKLSSSDQNDTIERKIGDVPSYVTGPASRACGSCHRTELINEDEAGELTTFNAHTETFGTLIEDNDGVLDEAIDTIMSKFN